MSDEMKVCPFCGEDIPIDTVKCEYCGEILNKEGKKVNKSVEVPYEYGGLVEVIDKIVKFIKSSFFKKMIITILILGITTCVIWVLGFDYPAVKLNHENFWYGQYLSSGILHTLLAILFAIIILILK